MTSFYLSCTSRNRGAIGIVHVYGREPVLATRLDARVGGRNGQKLSIPLKENELRYGWLRTASGGDLDEVMLGKTVPGMRVLMVHGGDAIHDAVCAWLEAEDFHPLGNSLDTEKKALLDSDRLYQPLLAGCVTESQVAAVLEGDAGDMLLMHRVLLCGRPNVGKSSLFNSLCGWERAFVHDGAGATADVVDEVVDLGGYGVWLGDMPGYAGGDAAWEMARRKLGLADLLLFVCDGAAGWGPGDEAAAAALAAEGAAGAVGVVAVNKADLGCAIIGEPWKKHFPGARALSVSSLPGGTARPAVEEAVCRFFQSS